jgi:hypothetical protein
VIVTDPVPPGPEKLNGISLAVAVQEDPVCVTVIADPAIVSVAVRWEKLFCPAAMVIEAGPVPLALDVILSHGALDDAVHVQDEGRLSIRVVGPPVDPNITEDGAINGS